MFSVQGAAGEVSTAVKDQHQEWTEIRRNPSFLGKVSWLIMKRFSIEFRKYLRVCFGSLYDAVIGW